MNSKLFLGIILIFALISSILFTVVEGACNYEDGGGISGSDGGSDNPLAVGTKGAPVTGRTDDACNEGTLIENESKLNEAQAKLGELKKIAESVGINIKTNLQEIKKNALANSQMRGAVGNDDDMDEDQQAAEAKQDAEICKKYPQSCGGDEQPKQSVSGSSYMDALRG